MSDSFLAEDPIENYLGKRVEQMERWELVSYLKNAMKALYGIELTVDGGMEPAVMRQLQKIYGEADAGRIVKWVVWRHFCRDPSNPGQYVRFSSFAPKKRKWWVDMMHAEMQERVMAENTPVVQSAATSVWL